METSQANFFDQLLSWTQTVDGWVWGIPMIALLLGIGLYLTVQLRVIQFRQLGTSFRLIFSKESRQGEGKGDISPWAALMTALSATVGNGNIAGVGTAIAIGGPGAPVYMWLAGLLGMATKYAEGLLGVHFRDIAPNDTMAGGPMYYLKNGLKQKKLGYALGAAFSVFGIIACLIGSGNMAQSNSMTAALANSLHQYFSPESTTQLPPTFYFLIIGLLISVMVAAVIIRGIKTIGKVAEKLVPGMIVFYFVFAAGVVLVNFTEIPAAFQLIFASAFGFQPLLGATVGMAVQRGISQGLLSSEAGIGSAAIAQAASNSDDPRKNGLIAMTGVFIDTILANTLTTLCIVLTGAYTYTQSWQGLEATNSKTSIILTQAAFSEVFPEFGGAIIAFASFLFGFTTLIGWSYYGEKCIEFLGGNKVVKPYRYAFILFVFIGAIVTPLAGDDYRYINIIWYVGNISNALMAVPNLIGLCLLSGVVIRLSKRD